MRIFLVLSNAPDPLGDAIRVVTDEILSQFERAGHSLFAQLLVREENVEPHERELAAAVRRASGKNITFGKLLSITRDAPPLPSWQRKLWERFAHWTFRKFFRAIVNPRLFPSVAFTGIMQKLAEDFKADVIVTIWSWEGMAATYKVKGIPKYAYYGNPDHKPPAIRLQYPDLFNLTDGSERGNASVEIWRRENEARKIQHIRMMNRVDMTVNNALIDAQFYAANGHRDSRYLQNMWPDPGIEPDFNRPVRRAVIGSVSNKGATGNTLALYYLGRYVAPALQERLGEQMVDIDVFGGGSPSPGIEAYLKHPSLRMRGWVEDLNKEIRESSAFIVLTNVMGFHVGNTRIVQAWSMGACVIAHKDSALSMPEMEHGVNILLGETPEEIVDQIVSVLSDDELRRRIVRGGYETYKKYYRPEIVVPQMLSQIQELVSGR